LKRFCREKFVENQTLFFEEVESKNPGPNSFLADVSLCELIILFRCNKL